ncbi:MAG: anti-sigma F factor [Agathobacter sp.]|nr:anti-sigma F factor [Agathobacter sp.]
MKNRTEVNHATVSFDACSMNEGFARMVVMGFMMDMNPTMDELQDVKTAVSEAVTNAIIHGYGAESIEVSGVEKMEVTECAQVEMTCIREGQKLTIEVKDCGIGIADIEEARQPFFTTKPDMERSGMGFAFMETFMDEVEVYSEVGQGTKVVMTKYIESSSASVDVSDGLEEASAH